MKKIFLSGISMLLMVSVLYAQTEEEPTYGWQKQTVLNLNFTNTSFDNWEKGGEDTWSWMLDIPINFTNVQEHFRWANTGKISFGRTKIGTEPSRKASDVIRLESVYTHNFGTFINPFVSFKWQTQFTTGYNYKEDPPKPISDFMDPGYFIQSAGIGYSPMDNLQIRFGLAVKETFTKEYPVPYTDDPETEEVEKQKIEVGANNATDFSIHLLDNLLLTSSLNLFTNFESFDQIDVEWDNTFTAKISEFLQVTLDFQMLYDSDISYRRQLKQSLAVGFSYALVSNDTNDE